MEQSLIEGVQLTPLKVIPTEGGDVKHALKSSEASFKKFGEAYFSHINYNEIKAWKIHKLMNMNLIVPVGKVKFVLLDRRADSPTYGKFNEFIIGICNYSRLTVPYGVAMGFQGLYEAGSMLLNIADIEHSPDEQEKLKLHDIKYIW